MRNADVIMSTPKMTITLSNKYREENILCQNWIEEREEKTGRVVVLLMKIKPEKTMKQTFKWQINCIQLTEKKNISE